MNILIISEYVQTGGIATYLLELCTALQKRGDKVHLVVLDCNEVLEAELNSRKISYYKISVSYRNFFQSVCSKAWQVFIYAWNELKNTPYDYVLLNTPVASLGLIFALWLQFKKPQVVYQFHGAIDLEEQCNDNILNTYLQRRPSWWHRFKKGIKYWLERNIQTFALSHTKTIITFSHYARNLVARHFLIAQNKILTVRPGFLPNPANPHAISGISRRLTPGLSLLITIARLEPRKGIFIYLEALQRLRRMGQRFIAIIYADFANPIATDLTQLMIADIQRRCLQNNVILLQHLNDNLKFALLKKANLFVLPSLDLETFGLVSLEAFSCGVPVCAFDIGANREVLVARKQLLVPTPNAYELAKTINRFLLLPKREVNLIKRRIHRNITKYKWDIYIRTVFPQ